MYVGGRYYYNDGNYEDELIKASHGERQTILLTFNSINKKYNSKFSKTGKTKV
jgi:hypothetical protein